MSEETKNCYTVDKYQAAYLQQINDEGTRLMAAQRTKLVDAVAEVAKDVGAPNSFIYDGVRKAFVPSQEQHPGSPVPEGSD